MTARDELNALLLAMAEQHRRPRCADDQGWTSDDADERAIAAGRCSGCPLLDPCGRVGLEEKHGHGIWGGVDLSRTTRPTGRPRKAAS